MNRSWQTCLFELLYSNRYLYWFASTVPFAGQWRVWQRLVLSRLHGHDVLELGCGLGDLLADMISLGYNCQAIDKSPEMVDAARWNLQRRNISDSGLIVLGEAQCLSFSNASFDTVVATFPSEYIYNPKTLIEIERVLRPGGHLIILLGGEILDAGILQPFLLLVRVLVYGPSILFQTKSQVNRDQMVKARIEQHGFRCYCEHIKNERWEVCILRGEKSN